VSRQVRTRAVLARTSQRVRGDSSIPALANPSRRLRNWPSIPSPQSRPLCMAGCGERCEAVERVVHPLSAFAAGSMAGDRLWFHCCAVASASLYRRPSDKCFHRAPILPYFPCSSSVTRSVLIPRPAARSVSASHSVRPVGFGFQKIFVQRTQKDFPNLPKKTPLGLGSGAHSRRFAQECPEGNPGKYKQGEKSWHSTKTT
jgi:hypothetical protein